MLLVYLAKIHRYFLDWKGCRIAPTNKQRSVLVMSVMTITSENFQQEVLNSNVPVLVDFWAEWCGPCRMMAPIVDQIAEEKAGSIKVGKIDIDQCPELAAQFGVMSIPTLIVFKNGQVACKNVGLVPKANVEQMLG